jgi:hypothetical protein
LSTNFGHNLFRFASIINPAALKSLSTAVDVAGGVRYLIEKNLFKGKDPPPTGNPQIQPEFSLVVRPIFTSWQEQQELCLQDPWQDRPPHSAATTGGKQCPVGQSRGDH